MSFDLIGELTDIDIFKAAKKTELFIGRPYYLDFSKAYLFVADAWKERVHGVPQGAFLLAFYENENDDVEECLLLRTLGPAKLPTDNQIINTMVEYYKDNLKTSGRNNQLDSYTQYTFSISGIECRILGTFYRGKDGKIQFGADVENYYSANNYVVYKAVGNVLEKIVNFRDGNTSIGSEIDQQIGKVRYSSTSMYDQDNLGELRTEVPVYVSPSDFLGKRTALFGMTRTGKSNTVKKIIEATSSVSEKTRSTCLNFASGSAITSIDPFDSKGIPRYKVGQIIFDINGEYANSNSQDEGSAIYKKYEDITDRYSVIEKEGFKPFKLNFYTEILDGFRQICTTLEDESGDYVKDFLAIDFSEPNETDYSLHKRWERNRAAYQCCLKKAGFKEPYNMKVKFSVSKKILDAYNETLGDEEKHIDPNNGISLQSSLGFWEWVAQNQTNNVFVEYRQKNNHDWIDGDLKAILSVLIRKKDLTGGKISGYKKFRPLLKYHTELAVSNFNKDIVDALRHGRIVIVDLSQGEPQIQQNYSKTICKSIFQNAMNNFVANHSNNFIQFYFEEAHNLFPKKNDSELTDIYNRLAKEGAKLNIGLIYATQEVSSISSNILKNTQNWFIAHLNNEDEIKEIRKFYDFSDFCEGLIRYSSGNDKGFIRMKTYSNSFVVPVKVDKFEVEKV